MSRSIVPQLVKKDLLIMRKTLLVYSLLALGSIVLTLLLVGKIPNWIVANVGFTLLLFPVATCGIVLAVKTSVFEKEKATQIFIMSLPVSARDFTLAKFLVNFPVFFLLWLLMTTVAFYISFAMPLFPMGTLPFMCILFLGILLAYTGVLCVSLVFQSLSITILSVFFLQVITTAYLWVVAYLESIAKAIGGPVADWNTTAIYIVLIQVLTIFILLAVTMMIQNRRSDFIT